MNIELIAQNIGSLSFLGIVVTLLVQWLKNKFGSTEYMTLVIVAVLSLISATTFWFIVQAGFGEALLTIVTIAGAIYAFVIERFEK